MRTNLIALSLAISSGLMVPLAVRANDIYVTNYSDGTIALVPSGGGKGTTFASGLKSPEGLAFGLGGTLYVDNQVSGVIDSVDATGKVTPFVTIPVSINNTLTGVGAMASDAAGNLYVSVLSPSEYGQIDKVSPNGTITTYATGVGNPQEIAFDGQGNLFVADIYNNTLDEVAPGGGIATTFASNFGSTVRGVAIDSSGNIYASVEATAGGYVEKFSSTGTDLGSYASVATPAGMAFDPDGDLLVASPDSSKFVYDVSGRNGKVSKYGTGLSEPLYLVVIPEPSSLGVLVVIGAGLIARRRVVIRA